MKASDVERKSTSLALKNSLQSEHLVYPETECHSVSERKAVLSMEGGNYYSLGIFHGEQILPSRVVPQMASAAQFFT